MCKISVKRLNLEKKIAEIKIFIIVIEKVQKLFGNVHYQNEKCSFLNLFVKMLHLQSL